MRNYWNKWSDFWFFKPDLFLVSFFRFVFSIVIFVMYLIRGLEFKLFFTNQGLMPVEILQNYLPEFLKPPLVFYVNNESISFMLYFFLMVLIFLMIIGLANKWINILTFVLHLSFVHRNPTILYGADLVSTFWLFYLCFIRHDRYFSIRSLLKLKEVKSDILSGVGLRFLQIQLCIIYGYTGLEKLKGTTWWEGSAVWYVMGNDNIVSYDLSFFQNMPWLVAVMTFSTLIFEIYFPMAIWLQPLKRLWLILGVGLHGLSAVFMGLIYFAPIMMSAYLLFLDPVYIRKKIEDLRLPSPMLKFINNGF
jgi:hypothetical protein